MSAEDTRNVIEIGDFVRSTLDGFICGFVLRVAHAGRQQGAPVARGFVIDLANDRELFIGEGELELIAKSDAWWVEWEQEHERPAIAEATA
jgi:hypothetical protein